MSQPDLKRLSARREHRHPQSALRHRTHRGTVGSIVTALLLSVFATLLGPLGTVQSASAADGHPTWKIGDKKLRQVTT